MYHCAICANPVPQDQQGKKNELNPVFVFLYKKSSTVEISGSFKAFENLLPIH